MTRSATETYEACRLSDVCIDAVDAERDAFLVVEKAQYALIEATLAYGAAREARRAADDAESAYYAQYALIEATLAYGAAREARRAADDAESAYYERME
jgi:hypothetical protein